MKRIIIPEQIKCTSGCIIMDNLERTTINLEVEQNEVTIHTHIKGIRDGEPICEDTTEMIPVTQYLAWFKKLRLNHNNYIQRIRIRYYEIDDNGHCKYVGNLKKPTSNSTSKPI